MRKLTGIVSILILTIGITIVSVIILVNHPEENMNQSRINFSFQDDQHLTFSGLQNSSFFTIKGTTSSIYPNEYEDVNVNIQVPRWSNDWINTTKSLVNLTNHDNEDLYVFFEAQNGNSHIKWIIIDFKQPEDELQASIIWNDKGQISYKGDFETQKINKNIKHFMKIPATEDSITHSIILNSIAIKFDDGLTKEQIQSIKWKLKLTPINDFYNDEEIDKDDVKSAIFNDNLAKQDLKETDFNFLTESTFLVLLLSAGLTVRNRKKS